MKSYEPRIVLWDEQITLRRENSPLNFLPELSPQTPEKTSVDNLLVNNPCLYDLQWYA
jgi:hypothetical protein